MCVHIRGFASPIQLYSLDQIEDQQTSSCYCQNRMWQAFIIILLFLWLVFSLFAWLQNNNSTNLPPSPPRRPIIGNLHQLLGSPAPNALRALSDKYGPLMLLQLGRFPTLVVSSPEIAREILKTHDLVFASRPLSKLARMLFYGCTDSTLAPYGERWIRAKKLCVTHLLSSKMVQSFQQIRKDEVEFMIARVHRMCTPNSSSGNLVNVTEVLSTFSADIISSVVSGGFFKDERRNRLIREIVHEIDNLLMREVHLADFFPMFGWLDIFDVDARAKRNAKRMDDVLEELLEHHANKWEDEKAQKPPDFVDFLLSLESSDGGNDNFPFTRQSMKTLLVDIFGAGTNGPYVVLERSMAELLRNPKAMEKLQGEVRGVTGDGGVVREEDLSRMSFLKAVVKEVLRLHSPGPLLIPHESLERCQVAGYEIPEKTRVIINAWAIGKDPKYWEEPDEFKPERFVGSSVDFRGNDFQFIPFGAGRRSCPGMNFAVPSIELALANLVYRFDWELPGDMKREDLDMNNVPGVYAHGKEGLELVAKLFSAQ